DGARGVEDSAPGVEDGAVGADAGALHLETSQEAPPVESARAEPHAPPPVDPELLARAGFWERALSASHGPKPLSVIERQFTSAYMPLRDAWARGAASETARGVLNAWAASFEKSYSDAFEVLRYRGKRPTMVLDLPDIAARIARLHGARTTQLILVDGM